MSALHTTNERSIHIALEFFLWAVLCLLALLLVLSMATNVTGLILGGL